ncbi:MAG: MFS transporter [Cyanobacteria bacterium]|nr:MFS transporter [Cyanobacteria bacterium CG_2015-16_32_12]NCO76761.1 MFS transporter [Cyanobacteria bacterium CG_2015-22_32_23]NCQ03895.1 MFS transporter [Cyanobacteria bacterium CG_2015-09_32_10]NCQ41705.1 MFS transporter [Cyanobacteria bacterium CG_2015-04_32_10]NCS85275.1 MFS transporter [Cyanobacteria bacterium CG_2015-02_32_10]
MNLPKIFQSLEKSKLINLLILFLCALFFWTSITCLLPTLPSYIQDIGATAKQVGYIMGCFAIGLLLSRVWLGKLADEGLIKFVKQMKLNSGITNFFIRIFHKFIGKLADYPSRKIVIIIGTLVATIAPMGYLWLNSIPQLMVIRAFHGISIAAFTTGYSALVVDLSPPKQRGELIGYMSLAVPIGMAIGPAVGGFLQEYTSYQILFTVSASCGILALILATQIREFYSSSQDNISTETDKANRSNFKDIISNPSFLVPTLILLLIGCLFGTLVTFLPLYLRYIQLDFNVGLFYTAAAIASFVVRFISGQASDKHGRGIFISISIICYILSMTLLTFVQSANILLLSAILEGTGAGMLVPITLALIADRCTSNERGKVFAICVSGFDVGVALGGPVLGSLLLDLGYRFMFGATAIMAIMALIIFIGFSNKNISNSWRFAFGDAPDLYALQSLNN